MSSRPKGGICTFVVLERSAAKRRTCVSAVIQPALERSEGRDLPLFFEPRLTFPHESHTLMHMSTRLQVLLDESEFAEIRRVAKRHHMTVAEWVRQALRAARRDEPVSEPRCKLAAVREAYLGAYPTADIAQMLTEIEQGYLYDVP
jgi:hypothetical protein